MTGHKSRKPTGQNADAVLATPAEVRADPADGRVPSKPYGWLHRRRARSFADRPHAPLPIVNTNARGVADPAIRVEMRRRCFGQNARAAWQQHPCRAEWAIHSVTRTPFAFMIAGGIDGTVDMLRFWGRVMLGTTLAR